MGFGRVLPSGHRLGIRPLESGRFDWSIWSIDGTRRLMTSPGDYGRHDDATRAGLAAYKRHGVVLNQLDMEKPRAQQLTPEQTHLDD